MTSDMTKTLQTAQLVLQDIQRWRPEPSSDNCPDCGVAPWSVESHKPECFVTKLQAVLRKVEEALTGEETEYQAVYHTEDDYYVEERGIFETYEFNADSDTEAREMALKKLVEMYERGNGNVPDAYVCRSIRNGDISDELSERISTARRIQRGIELERQAKLAEKQARLNVEAKEAQERAEYERLKAKYEGGK